jgi:hypothetical protein
MNDAELQRELAELKRQRQAQCARQDRERDRLVPALRMTLRSAPAGHLRGLGKPRVGDTELAATIGAQTIIQHLERAGFRIAN